MVNSRTRTPFYIFFLNPVYVAARSLRSLCSNEYPPPGLPTTAQNLIKSIPRTCFTFSDNYHMRLAMELHWEPRWNISTPTFLKATSNTYFSLNTTGQNLTFTNASINTSVHYKPIATDCHSYCTLILSSTICKKLYPILSIS